MCPLLESIKLKDGCLFNLEYHQNRLNESMKGLFPKAACIDLSSSIVIPESCASGLFKVRILYGPAIEKIEFEFYQFRTIKSLKVVHHDSLDYSLKYSNRQTLQELYNQRGDCDDIIIVRNGQVTDSFAANLSFFDGQKWVTPESPLLKGTQRQYLLDRELISEKEIREEDIHNYQKVGLINAMMDIEDMPVVPVDYIEF
jgi:4-amino-4-deoxychorismate lyase